MLQTGEIAVNGTTTFTLALGFGASTAAAESTARASLDAGFAARSAAYADEWHSYLDGLAAAPAALTGGLLTQYDVALMTVKAHEDKTYRGAFIASLTLPWGFAVNADEGGGGYHFVWARDEYQQVSSLLAAGDRAAAERAVTWLFTRPAAGRRDVPAELARGRLTRPAQRPARRDRVPDHPGVAALAHRRRDLGGRAQGRQRARGPRAGDAAGALGGNRRLLATRRFRR